MSEEPATRAAPPQVLPPPPSPDLGELVLATAHVTLERIAFAVAAAHRSDAYKRCLACRPRRRWPRRNRRRWPRRPWRCATFTTVIDGLEHRP